MATLGLINADGPEMLLRTALRVSDQFDAYWVAAEVDGSLEVTVVDRESARRLRLVGLPSKLVAPNRPTEPLEGDREIAAAIKKETGFPTTLVTSLGGVLPWTSVLGACPCQPRLELGREGGGSLNWRPYYESTSAMPVSSVSTKR